MQKIDISIIFYNIFSISVQTFTNVAIRTQLQTEDSWPNILLYSTILCSAVL